MPTKITFTGGNATEVKEEPDQIRGAINAAEGGMIQLTADDSRGDTIDVSAAAIAKLEGHEPYGIFQW